MCDVESPKKNKKNREIRYQSLGENIFCSFSELAKLDDKSKSQITFNWQDSTSIFFAEDFNQKGKTNEQIQINNLNNNNPDRKIQARETQIIDD